MANLTIVQKVLNFIKSSEEGNVSAVIETAKKLWSKNIAVATRNIENITRKLKEDLAEQAEYLAEAKTSLDESFLNIYAEKMTKDERTQYVECELQDQISNALYNVERIEAKVKSLQEVADKAIERENKSIANYTKYLEQYK